MPRPEQLFEQWLLSLVMLAWLPVTGFEQFAPSHPGAQKHLPYLQTPCLWQLLGHVTTVPQSSPSKPGWQKQVPRVLSQTP